MNNGQELSNTRIAWNEARLTLSEEFVLYKIIEQGIKYKVTVLMGVFDVSLITSNKNPYKILTKLGFFLY